MPRPKPDQIIRHQIVLGEADRKRLDAAIDAYTVSNLSRNLVTLLNDVTGMITVLTIAAATGILGVSFVFQISPVHLATGNTSAILKDFNESWLIASLAQKKEREEKQEERVQNFQNNPDVAADVAQRIADDPLGMLGTVNPAANVLNRYLGLFD